MKIPSSKLQAPEKRQAPIRKSRAYQSRNVALSGLEFGVWDFSGFWGLGFGASRFPFRLIDIDRQKTKRHRSAFTLIELVISSALMAMILVSGYLCLIAGVTSRKLIESRNEVVQNARVAMALMTADLRSACTLSKQFEFVGMHRMLGEVEADNLGFATHNFTPTRAREGDWCEVSYFLEKDPESGTISLWRRRDATPDEDPLSGGKREEIAWGLRGLRFEYYDGFDWYDEWGDPEGRWKGQNSLLEHPNISGLPEAVRITLWLDSGSPSSGGKSVIEKSDDKDSAEPPLVFQTVARLNLAASSKGGGFGLPLNPGGGNAPGQTGQITPGGPQ